MHESCHTHENEAHDTIHCTHEWVSAHMNESWHTWMRHVTYTHTHTNIYTHTHEWVISHDTCKHEWYTRVMVDRCTSDGSDGTQVMVHQGMSLGFVTHLGGVCCVCIADVAMCCSVFQVVATCCNVLQGVAVYYSALQYVVPFGSVLQCAAVCCSQLQWVAVGCSRLHWDSVGVPCCKQQVLACSGLRWFSVGCCVLQGLAVCDKMFHKMFHSCVWQDVS